MDLLLRFGNTPTRRDIASAFLDYRAALHGAGLTRGFQWVNGSFVEDSLQNRLREPRDVDVVTFFHMPERYDLDSLPDSFLEVATLSSPIAPPSIDAYHVVLDAEDLRYLSNRIAYWNSLWSHTRDGQWKGYLEIDLSDEQDAAARDLLRILASEDITL